MQTILQLISAKVQYDRGVQTGLVGLIAIGLCILGVYLWSDYIYPVVDKLGLVAFAEKMGLIYEGSPIMTFWNVLIFCLITILLIWVLVFIAFCLMLLFLVFPYPFYAIIGLILLVFYWIPEYIGKGVRNITYFCISPSSYKEYRRLNKNKEAVKLLKDNGKEITLEEAQERLQRLPTYGDNSFLYGVTYDRDCYVLLPHYVSKSGRFMVIPFVAREIKELEKVEFAKGKYTMMYVKKQQAWFNMPGIITDREASQFEELYECDANAFKHMLDNILYHDTFKEYVEKTNQNYKYEMDALKYQINKGDKSEKVEAFKQMNTLKAWNDDIIQLMDSF